MPSYKDTDRGTWYAKFNYTDWTGKKRQKLKRGFTTKKEAAAWERDFLLCRQRSPEMTFQALYDLYLEDINHRLKHTTITHKTGIYENHILPYFKQRPISQITPADIRSWQNQFLTKKLSASYQRIVNAQLVAILSYAVKYYGLPKNPCDATMPIGDFKSIKISFWTLEEFNAFMPNVDTPAAQAAFYTFFYAGLRSGELLALTRQDINLEEGFITINKTFHRHKGVDFITSPKTANSNRTVTIPEFLVEQLQVYFKKIYNLKPDTRIFPVSQSTFGAALRRACSASGIKPIRIHDLRHSHVSLLIDMGFQPPLIAERIGDTVAMVNNTYGHLYPNRHQEVADQLNKIANK